MLRILHKKAIYEMVLKLLNFINNRITRTNRSPKCSTHRVFHITVYEKSTFHLLQQNI